MAQLFWVFKIDLFNCSNFVWIPRIFILLYNGLGSADIVVFITMSDNTLKFFGKRYD